MAFVVLRRRWLWPMWRVAALLVPLLAIELVFFSANVIKLLQGAWVPIVAAIALIVVMLTWRRGTGILAAEERSHADLKSVLKLGAKPPLRVNGTAVFLTATPKSAPSALLHNLKHNHMLHERNILLLSGPRARRACPTASGSRSSRCRRRSPLVAHYGFMETPDVMRGLALCRHRISTSTRPPPPSSCRAGRCAPPPGRRCRAAGEAVHLACRRAENATTYFQIPHDRVVEIGTQINV